MTRSTQGDLTNLWAAGGKQVFATSDRANRGYYQYCPECGWQLTGKFSTCPRCSADLRLITCPYCGGEVPFKADPCPRCTAPLK